ncbi:MAG: hypothetical protein JRH20_25630 [Deltaproteobacteria bacterium]|nr:hypothetical protein [Deltaproteobacteria bacterium]
MDARLIEKIGNQGKEVPAPFHEPMEGVTRFSRKEPFPGAFNTADDLTRKRTAAAQHQVQMIIHDTEKNQPRDLQPGQAPYSKGTMRFGIAEQGHATRRCKVRVPKFHQARPQLKILLSAHTLQKLREKTISATTASMAEQGRESGRARRLELTISATTASMRWSPGFLRGGLFPTTLAAQRQSIFGSLAT